MQRNRGGDHFAQRAQADIVFLVGEAIMADKSRFSRTEDTTLRAQDLRSEVSKTETRLWPRLCKSRMGAPFRRQHPVGPYFADYCCVALKLVIEVDGPLHSKAEDDVRDRFMGRQGYDVIRFSLEDIDKRFRSVIDTIHDQIQMRLLEKDARGTK